MLVCILHLPTYLCQIELINGYKLFKWLIMNQGSFAGEPPSDVDVARSYIRRLFPWYGVSQRWDLVVVTAPYSSSCSALFTCCIDVWTSRLFTCKLLIIYSSKFVTSAFVNKPCVFAKLFLCRDFVYWVDCPWIRQLRKVIKEYWCFVSRSILHVAGTIHWTGFQVQLSL